MNTMDAQGLEQELITLPTPDHITLLLKHHKSTVLLSVLPNQPFSEVKTLLIAALRSRNITTLPGGEESLPVVPEDIEFGVLKDRKDVSKGWVILDVKERDTLDNKGAKRKTGVKNSAPSESPAGAGLVDGSWLAYRTRTHEDHTKMEDEDEVVIDPGWNVVLPSYDDEDEGQEEKALSE